MTTVNSSHLNQILTTPVSAVRDRLKETPENPLKSPEVNPRLTSGLTSHYYINGKLTCADPEGLFSIARLLIDRIRNTPAQAVGGPTLGADPIVGAVCAVSHLLQHPLPQFIVRKETKKHGTQQMIEGADIQGKKVVLVEDVVTTGGSLVKAIDAVRAANADIIDIICLVDREQGGKEAFQQLGVPYNPLFYISEILPAEVLQRS